MRTLRRNWLSKPGMLLLLLPLLCSPLAAQTERELPQVRQPRDEALPPPPPPPATFEPLGPPEVLKIRLQQRTEELEQTDEQRRRELEAKADDPFVPIDQLPPEEQLPAAPMLIAAYAFAVLALFAYVLSISRRLGSVKQEIARLELETKRPGQT